MAQIITDSSTLYTIEEAKKAGFEAVPLCVSVGDLEGRDMHVDMDEFYSRIKAGQVPMSSQPPIGDVLDVFEAYKDDEIIATEPDNKYTKIEAHLTHMSVRGVESMEEALDFAPDKFLYVDEPERIEELLPIMQKRFEDRLNIFRSEPFFMEIVPMGIDKAKSLDRLLDKLGMDSTKLVACGDGFNDVSMVNFAGMGVAMANACAETKAVANYIAPSCDEDGVADAIKKFF